MILINNIVTSAFTKLQMICDTLLVTAPGEKVSSGHMWTGNAQIRLTPVSSD